MTREPPSWRVRPDAPIDLSRPRIMAILNVTPDSFADGGRFASPQDVATAARRAVDQGADLLDIGGESTRPGAERVAPDEQIERVVPAVRAIRDAGIKAPISVDTTRSAVARAALDAGADAINDVSAGEEDDAMLALAAERACGVVLMHRLTPPNQDRYSDQYDRAPAYADVVDEVGAYLCSRLEDAVRAGVAPESVVVDPGLGFGKSVEQNLALIAGTGAIASRTGRPVLSALSRKSFVGRVSLGRDSDPAERLEGTLALSAAHLLAGARVFRVHDVGEHARALPAAQSLPAGAFSPAVPPSRGRGARGVPS